LRLTEKDFDKLEYSEILFMSKMLGKEEAKRNRELKAATAFSVWIQVAKEGDRFDKFLKDLGLMEKEKKPNEKALKHASKLMNRIKAMSKRKRK
jgi:hypothetical protein